MKRDQLRDRMGAAARRETAEPVGDRPRPAEPKVRAYKGTFELARPAARQLRLAALEHDTSITRLLEAAALVILDDPAVLEQVLRVADRLARERT